MLLQLLSYKILATLLTNKPTKQPTTNLPTNKQVVTKPKMPHDQFV